MSNSIASIMEGMATSFPFIHYTIMEPLIEPNDEESAAMNGTQRENSVALSEMDDGQPLYSLLFSL